MKNPTFNQYLGLVLLLVSVTLWLWPSKIKQRNLIWSDAEGYYMYLPAFFIHDGFANIDVKTKQVFKRQPNTNKYYTKYSMGVAIAQLPAFLITDVYHRKIKGDVASGNETPYSVAIAFTGWIMLFIGLFYLIKWLKNEFSISNIAIGCIAMVYGTNLWYYTTREPGASHIYSFGLFAVVIYLADKIYREQRVSWLQSVALGILLSWIILIRPTNAIIFLFIGFYTPSGIFNLRERLNFWFSRWMKIIPFFLISAVLWYIQIKLWSDMRGETAIYSYSQEGFIYWVRPKILRVLLDVQNGLLIYSPVIWLSLYGLLRYFNEKAATSRLIFAIFLIMTWVFGSWWAWWFGGAYGHRFYVEFYTILLLPLLWVIRQVNDSRNIVSQFLFYGFLLLMIYYSYHLSALYVSPWDGPNWNWDRFSDIVRSIFW